MKRRDFLKYSSAVGAGSMFLNSLPVQSFATPNMLPLLNCQGVDERVLVVVFLSGGNDGLNTIVPLNQLDWYNGHRENIGLESTINLDTTLSIEDQVGLHPAMTDFKTMYDEGRAQLLQGVGYPNSNGSHFKSTDLWMTGGDGTPANFNVGTGWMGRFLNNTFPGMNGNPNAVLQDPLGIQLGNTNPSIGFISDQNEWVASNLTQDPSGLYNLVQSIGTPPHLSVPNSDYGNHLNYIMSVENSTNVYAQRITDVYNTGTNSTVTYPDNRLAPQLETIAKLLSGGSKTKIFLAHIGGFDTHSDQVETSNTSIGTHANLLTDVFGSIKAFHDDLALLGLEDKVMTLTFSEFGRRITENASWGTDHGNLAPMFLFGPGAEAGVKGTNLNLDPAVINSSGYIDNNAQMQFDYRQVYRTLLQDWLGGSETVMQSTYFGSFAKIPNMINTNFVVDPSCYFDAYIAQTVVQGKVFLEGMFNSADEQMDNKLQGANLLPLSQPYAESPFQYEGIESAAILPLDTVDWVLVELRDSSNINTVIAKRAALVRKDGRLMEMNGNEGVTFIDILPQSYYIAVYHRNHIPIVSAVSHDTSNVASIYDFTVAGAAMGSGTKDLNGNFAMYAGNFDGNGKNDTNDNVAWAKGSSTVNSYLPMDGDGNGIVNNLDYNLWKNNKTQVGNSIFQ